MVTLDEIGAEARRVDPTVAAAAFGRFLLTILGGLFYVLGWVPARTLRVAWVVLAWTFAAVKLGWQDGRKRADRR